MNEERLAVRIYGTLVGLYPGRFRDEYGDDMVQLMRDQYDDEPAWRVCTRAAADLALSIPTQHLEARMNRTPNHTVPLLYTAIATAGLLLAIAGGTNLTMLIVGLCVAVGAGAMAVVAWRRAGPVGAKIHTQSWWKFVLAGPCIVASVIVAAGLGVEAWFLGLLLVLGAVVITGFGLLLGLVRLTGQPQRR